MLYIYRVKLIRYARPSYFPGNSVTRNEACSPMANWPHEFCLDNIADSNACVPCGPSLDRSVEASADPPTRVLPRKVQREFISTYALSLAYAVCSQHQAFAVLSAGRKELLMLDVQ